MRSAASVLNQSNRGLGQTSSSGQRERPPRGLPPRTPRLARSARVASAGEHRPSASQTSASGAPEVPVRGLWE
eukprot:4326433-Alexandrium_andersonii.AAC.1